jgi:hypothetical protein
LNVIDIGMVEHGTWNPESPETLGIHVWQYMYVFLGFFMAGIPLQSFKDR